MKTSIQNSLLGLAAAIFLTGAAVPGFAQPGTPPPPKPKIKIEDPVSPEDAVHPKRPARPAPKPHPSSRGNQELSMKVDGNVNVVLTCIREGSVRVNGWNRNEVRVFIADGRKFAIKTVEKNPKTGEPTWLRVVSSESRTNYGPSSECISGSEIEVDAPVGASISINGSEISAKVDSVKKVEVTTIGGDVSLSRVSHGVKVVARQGDITVESCGGSMNLDTTTGNILVFEAGPSETGDVFKAKTSGGAIALQGLGYRRIEVDSITGSLAYSGEILGGGFYGMRTQKGSIRLTIPAKSSFQMWATYGYGYFDSQIPIDIVTENVMPGALKSIRGKAGSGDATVKLSTTNGSIGIKKL